MKYIIMITDRRRHRQPMQMMVIQITKAEMAIIVMTTNAEITNIIRL